MRKLVVTAAFRDFEVGQEITDEDLMAEVEKDNPDKVVAVLVEEPKSKTDASSARKS